MAKAKHYCGHQRTPRRNDSSLALKGGRNGRTTAPQDMDLIDRSTTDKARKRRLRVAKVKQVRPIHAFRVRHPDPQVSGRTEVRYFSTECAAINYANKLPAHVRGMCMFAYERID